MRQLPNRFVKGVYAIFPTWWTLSLVLQAVSDRYSRNGFGGSNIPGDRVTRFFFRRILGSCDCLSPE